MVLWLVAALLRWWDPLRVSGFLLWCSNRSAAWLAQYQSNPGRGHAAVYDTVDTGLVRFPRPRPPAEPVMTRETEVYEELDVVSSFHWASQSEVYSALLLPGLNTLAILVAPFLSRTGIVAVPVASVELESSAEQQARGTVRLSQLADWTAPSETVCEVALIELSPEEWAGVDSVLSTPEGSTLFHADGRMPYGPDLLFLITNDGRYGKLNEDGVLVTSKELRPIGDDGENFEEPLETPAFPVPKARGPATAVRKGRSSAVKATPARRQSASAFQSELRELISDLSQRMEAIERGPSDRHPASKPSVQVGTSTAPTLLGSVAKPAGGSAFDRARELLGGPKIPHIPIGPPAKVQATQSSSSHEPLSGTTADLTSSLGRIADAQERGRTRSSWEAGFVSQGAAAQSEEEYAGLIADGAGATIKMGGCALLERIRKTREEHPEIILAAHENAVKKDLGVLPGEAWSWTRHCYETVLPHCSHFRSLKRICALLAAALDKGRSGSLERQQALLCQMYTVCEAAAKDPSHDLGWGWPVLGIRDPEGRAQPGWLPAESCCGHCLPPRKCSPPPDASRSSETLKTPIHRSVPVLGRLGRSVQLHRGSQRSERFRSASCRFFQQFVLPVAISPASDPDV